MPSTEPVRVTIFNQTYSLVSADDSSQVQDLAQRVDELMTSIAARAGNIDSTRTAVLACLHLADQLRTLERELQNLRSSVDTKAEHFTLLLDEAIGAAD
jgi:cell division protein ZapA